MKSIYSISLSRVRMPLLIALMLTYLGFHVMNGERGLYALFKETHQQEALKQELAELTDERRQMELQVTGLRSGSLDRDLLDEQARRMLGMIGKGEKLVLLKAQ